MLLKKVCVWLAYSGALLLATALSADEPNRVARDEAYRRGVEQCGRGSHEAAATHFQQAIDCDAGSSEAWNGLGAARYVGGDYPAARQALDRALELRPNNQEARLNRALVGIEQGDLTSAEQDIKACQRGTDAEPRLQAAEARLTARRTEAEARRLQSEKDPTAGLTDLLASLVVAQQAAQELREAAATRDLGKAFGSLGKLGGLLTSRRKQADEPAKRPVQKNQTAAAPSPFSLDASGRLAPSLAPLPERPPPEAPAAVKPQTSQSSKVPSFAEEETAIRAALGVVADRLEARDVAGALAGFAAPIQAKVREAFSDNPDRMPPLAKLLRQAKITILSEETPATADGTTRQAEVVVSSAERSTYLQLAKTGGVWRVCSI